MPNPGTAAAGGDRFDRVEALLKSYPQLSDSELAELKRWWTKEASAFDVASLASKDELKEPYSRFRDDHLDRFSAKEIAIGLLGIVFIVGLAAAMGWLSF